MVLYAKAEAYSTRLQLATKLSGRAKLVVLRNVYRRLNRWQSEITTDLSERLEQSKAAEKTYSEDPEMLGRIALATEQLTKAKTAWEDTAMEQNAANLARLEDVLTQQKNA